MKISIFLGITALVIIFGLGLYVSDFTVYLGSDPGACNNCHIMDAAYEGWFHGSHKMWANCNDCHTPHETVPKYIIKAYAGANHVTHFSLGLIPEPIRAKTYTKDIIQNNCIRCHTEAISMIYSGMPDYNRYCFSCHRTVAHGERGISLLPYQDKGTLHNNSNFQEKENANHP